jgi:hypothetical protein
METENGASGILLGLAGARNARVKMMGDEGKNEVMKRRQQERSSSMRKVMVHAGYKRAMKTSYFA